MAQLRTQSHFDDTPSDINGRARQIRLMLFDADGVLTDGTIWFFPTGPANGEEAPPMVEVKGFSAHDGIGLVLARRAGLKTGVITKRKSASLALRAGDLRMDYVYQGSEHKDQALAEILAKSGLSPEQVACMGDDVVDLPLLRKCGLAGAPANARPEVIAAAHYVAPHAGGFGAARDFVEFVLKAQGVWENVIEQFLHSPDPEPEVLPTRSQP